MKLKMEGSVTHRGVILASPHCSSVHRAYTSMVAFACGHTASNAPDPIRTRKLIGARPGQYWGGGPPGKPFGCRKPFCVYLTLEKQKANSTLRASRAVPHPSTDRAFRRLTSEFGWDRVYSTKYGRWRHATPKHVPVGFQLATCDGRFPPSLAAIPRRMHRISSDLRS